MFKNFRITVCFLVTLLMILGGLIPVYAQDDSLVRTGNAISLRIKFPNSEAVQVVVIEGGALTLKKDGVTVVLVPSVSDTAEGTVRLGVFQPVKDLEPQSLQETKGFTLSINSSKKVKTDLNFKVKLEGVKRFADQGRNAGAVFQKVSYSPAQTQGECCVVCNGVFYCTNCSITASCGSCCTDFCRTKKLCPANTVPE